MNNEVLAFAQVAVIVVLLAGTLSAITVGLVRGLSPKRKPVELNDAQNLQLQQLQQSVDAELAVIRPLSVFCLIGAVALAATSLFAQSSGSGAVVKPPAGMCRIWVDGVRADKQPAPTDCASALKNKPTNGRVIFGDPKPVVSPVRPRRTSESRPDTSKSKRDTARPRRHGSRQGCAGIRARFRLCACVDVSS